MVKSLKKPLKRISLEEILGADPPEQQNFIGLRPTASNQNNPFFSSISIAKLERLRDRSVSLQWDFSELDRDLEMLSSSLGGDITLSMYCEQKERADEAERQLAILIAQQTAKKPVRKP